MICVLILVLASAPGFGQSSAKSAAQPGTAAVAAATAVPAIPKDPKDLMLLAAKVNGLGGRDMKPWHLKANYQTFDADGKPKDKGVFEEWWAGPEKWKVSYTSNGFNQVRYGTGKKMLMTGDDTAPSLVDELLERLLAQPMPKPNAIKWQKYVVQNAMDGSVALTCVRENSKSTLVPVYCFGIDSPVLRLEALRDGNMASFNNIVSMDGKYIAKRIDVKFASLPVLQVQVTTLAPLTKVDDAALAPPPGAVAALLPPQFVSLDDLRLISIGKHPETPHIARAAHVHGTVIVAMIISPKGNVSEVRVISGPAML